MILYNTSNVSEWAGELRAGDEILLSGVVYTARDAAHKRIFDDLAAAISPPFDICGATIYYAGPTPSSPQRTVGSFGPTTSGRMDIYTPKLYDMGLACTIGKGKRTAEVSDSIIRNHGIYLCALGGAGALASRCISSLEVIAYEDLGCESIKRLIFHEFPLYVGIDCFGGDIYSFNFKNNPKL